MAVVLQLPKDINRFCRACMNITDETVKCFDNYIIKNNEPTELCKMFESVTSLNIILDDGLPETICYRCTEQIAASFMFKSQCLNVDKQLRSLRTLADPSTKEIKEDISHECRIITELEDNMQCNTCGNTFSSTYEHSMHMIKHERMMSLFERFIKTHTKDLQIMSKTTVLATDVLHLIKARKLDISGCPILKDEINEKDNLDNIIKDTCTIKHNTNKKCVTKGFSCKKGIKCKVCLGRFSNRKELILHICKPVVNEDYDASNPRTTCSLCERQFPNPSTLSLHLLKHTLLSLNVMNASIDNEIIFCEICGQTCESEFNLEQHYDEKHNGKPPNLCVNCCQIFDDKDKLVAHDCIRVEDFISAEEKSIRCILCNITYASKEALFKHSLEHLVKRYACKKCCLSFCTRDSYFAHITTHANSQYPCPTCGKSLSTKSALKSHIVCVHSNEFKHTCKICGKRFATAGRLKIHSQIHKTQKKHICSYCGYRTNKAGDLQMHVRIHTSERPYKCTFANCDASFKTSSHLCEHVRRHLHIKKFKCDVCDSWFSSGNSLKIHYMQHTGEKPFSCTVCNTKFRRRHHLQLHLKQHSSKID